MSPSAAGGVDLSTAHGRTQFGCCPKTSAGPGGRRVMFGWLQNGGSDGGEPDRRNDIPSTNNTLTLPRDLSLDPDDGGIRQAPSPPLPPIRAATLR